MNTATTSSHSFTFRGRRLTALPSGALWWQDQSLLCVSDLHLGKSERMMRRRGVVLPPYETEDTLLRLAQDLERTAAKTVICLGDSFDDLAAARALPDQARLEIAKLQAGRKWIWIEGNHDPGPVEFGGTHLAELVLDTLTFRHIAEPDPDGEISGHYHPKARVQTRARPISRPAFLVDEARIILPAYGTYTGGLWSHSPDLQKLMAKHAIAILTGRKSIAVPMPRSA